MQLYLCLLLWRDLAQKLVQGRVLRLQRNRMLEAPALQLCLVQLAQGSALQVQAVQPCLGSWEPAPLAPARWTRLLLLRQDWVLQASAGQPQLLVLQDPVLQTESA